MPETNRRDKLRTRAPDQTVGVVKIPTPIVKVAAPQVNVKAPEVNVPPIDTTDIDAAIRSIEKTIGALVMHMDMLATKQQRMLEIIAQIADKDSTVNIEAPIVKIPPRPRSFRVTAEDENGDTVEMRVVAESPN